ncbi:MAG: MotA/TolQ/ExbB proton channel family protein [Gammaproteobacteria bacterium]|nr:MotA/TolQ/ExbB proton channel family protein [Gammaproteobacteria bacterium]
MIIADIFDKGGIVVWVLAGYSLIALTILLERMIHFGLMRGHSQKFEQQLVAALQQGTVEQLIEKMRGPEANILRGMMQASREGITDLGRVASRIGSIELQRMERGFRTLSILGNTAPLLGLLGTIIGMIKAFMVIEQAGGRVDAQALAGGIWEAMLTTGVGLVVAIPVLLLLHILEGMADRRAQNMRSDASLLLEQLPHVSDGDQSEVVHHREGVLHAV